jgi:hypothetical protein
MAPGIKPAIKSSSILRPDTYPYKMTGRLGGKLSPRLPPVVTRPMEKFSLYCSLIREGKRRPPSAIIVMPVAPLTAVKKAQEIIATTPSSSWQPT